MLRSRTQISFPFLKKQQKSLCAIFKKALMVELSALMYFSNLLIFKFIESNYIQRFNFSSVILYERNSASHKLSCYPGLNLKRKIHFSHDKKVVKSTPNLPQKNKLTNLNTRAKAFNR